MTDLQKICIEVFSSVSSTTSILVIPIFMGRIAMSNVVGGGSKAFDALKGVVIYFVLVEFFPLILDLLFSIPEAFLPKTNPLNSFGDDIPGWDISSIPFILDKILEVILALLYWIVYYLHIFFMLLMCSMAPIVFLVSSLLGIGLGLEVFLGLLIVGSSWPIIWFGFDQVHSSLALSQDNAFGGKCLELLLTLFKGLGPVAFAGMVIKSPAGRAVSQSAKMAMQPAIWTGGKAKGGAQKVKKNYVERVIKNEKTHRTENAMMNTRFRQVSEFR